MHAYSKKVRSTIVSISTAINKALEARTIHPFLGTEAYYVVKGEGTLCDHLSHT